MMTALPFAGAAAAPCACSRNRSASVSPATPSVPAVRNSRRETPSQRRCPRPENVNMSQPPRHPRAESAARDPHSNFWSTGPATESYPAWLKRLPPVGPVAKPDLRAARLFQARQEGDQVHELVLGELL